MKIQLESLKDSSVDQSVNYLTELILDQETNNDSNVDCEMKGVYLVQDYGSFDFLSKFHKKMAHKNPKNMLHALSQAKLITPDTRKLVDKVVESCVE